MKAKEFVKSLFKDYEESPALGDFMEEIQSNLEERTASLVKKGLSEDEAFAKASAELGDIGALAAEMSLKRRQEVYQDAYLGIQRYMKPARVAGYVAFGAALVFGIICALIVYFSGMDRTGAFGTFLPFFTAAVAGFTFLGLTQETAADYPMKKKRAAWYSLAAGFIAFGIVLFPVIYFSVTDHVLTGTEYLPKHFPFFIAAEWKLVPALAAEIPFLIPGIGLLVFLCLTEKNRLKPWALQYAASFSYNLEHQITDKANKSAEQWQNPAYGEQFGLFSGAIWIFAVGLFIALGFAIGFKYSWLVFIFATAVQLFVQALMCKPNSGNKE
ncbi:MAG: permease prefix domain 1-containing protein [Spirochaetaceae bacterium]|jgi:hypothetical protein|nr:permease prefix domain 1-containing protein [Spirochaetaceae bacterium]